MKRTPIGARFVVAIPNLVGAAVDGVADLLEGVVGNVAQEAQRDDHDDGDQHEDQSVFNKALALFTRFVDHYDFSLANDVRMILFPLSADN